MPDERRVAIIKIVTANEITFDMILRLLTAI